METPTRRMLWVPSRRTSSQSPLPTLRAMMEEAPMPMPSATLERTMVSGKVNVMAATCLMLSWPMKPISRVCTRIAEEIPIVMGAVSFSSDTGTEPWVKSRCAIRFVVCPEGWLPAAEARTLTPGRAGGQIAPGSGCRQGGSFGTTAAFAGRILRAAFRGRRFAGFA